MNQTTLPLEIGADVPDVIAVDQDGNSIPLQSIAKKGTFLFYFYPKADTPGCIKEACNLRDNYKMLIDHGIKIFGISMDTKEAQKNFKEKYHLPFPLLADPEGKLVEKFGVTKKNGHASRQSFLARNGKIVWRNLKVKPETHAQEILEEVKKLNESKE
ncbi:peroxiredoxin [Candidatus Methylacidiphilum fumarolicum]|uniref:thioredoxin-dependent peroxiredoxin n=2 Tax=Candidatus Methylacidiphilum fumarolicum TaxID=591154 RepID=I0JWP6_METFB|nr:peroxiredoxin [Candidatus Methylacidiphilum fumarolicum]MBW6414361.1 peroxiredoxin [Candidatus Methylacidiphilum fumarolicum]TFE67853.1 alkyl hydroperoxide reductase [Candidatus Methylacidiphilum fumarolicum]TFE73001.1 peroxiredoxin [Candidatus Methylacidiphilum fumarolicum]TFE75092.1 peroxiredoxin [Candidatus Methylacidiphilum fumarolicum]TFE76314.1 alkyl hydroperoxide reductase [Candidatus Methylacidiphilum fumarolicum]